jgi:hypothetical protein
VGSPHAPSDLGGLLPGYWHPPSIEARGGAGLAGFLVGFSSLGLAGLWDVGAWGASLGRLAFAVLFVLEIPAGSYLPKWKEVSATALFFRYLSFPEPWPRQVKTNFVYFWRGRIRTEFHVFLRRNANTAPVFGPPNFPCICPEVEFGPNFTYLRERGHVFTCPGRGTKRLPL